VRLRKTPELGQAPMHMSPALCPAKAISWSTNDRGPGGHNNCRHGCVAPVRAANVVVVVVVVVVIYRFFSDAQVLNPI